MNKSELINKMSEKTSMSKKDTEKALTAFIECVSESLIDGEKVQLSGFGTFDVRFKDARPGRNPKQPEIEIMIPAQNTPVFKPGKLLKEQVNQK